MDRHTTIDTPYFEGPGGILLSAIDILPTELRLSFHFSESECIILKRKYAATDASEHFSNSIIPYVEQLISSSRTTDQVKETLDRASIVRQGELTSRHAWLQTGVDIFRQTRPVRSSQDLSRPKKILLLGSGLVTGPAVEVLAARDDVSLSIGKYDLQR